MTKRKPLFWHLYPAFLVLSLLAVFMVTTRLYYSFKAHTIEDSRKNLQNIGDVFKKMVFEPNRDLNDLQKISEVYNVYVKVKDQNGKIVFDNKPLINARGEVLIGKSFLDYSSSNTAQTQLIDGNQYLVHVANIETSTGEYTVNLLLPFDRIENLIGPFREQLFYIGVLLFAMIAIVSWLFTRSLVTPLQLIQSKTEKMSEGDFHDKIPVQSLQIQEFRVLASSINKMASQLFRRLKTISRQRNEKEAIFSSLNSGVLAINKKSQVFSLNRAGRKLLEFKGEDFKGQSLPAIVRIPELEKLIKKSLHVEHPQEIEVTLLHKTPEQHLLVRTSPLVNEKGEQDGIVVTFSDITKIKKLKDVKRDFVANVSHELKTPLTSIKGYAETLLETEGLSEEQKNQFINIIYKHAAGLNQIVDELLDLAKYEEQTSGQFEAENLDTVLKDACENYRAKARDKDIVINYKPVEEQFYVRVNGRLIQQAVSNLISNAIKYTDVGGHIDVTLDKTDKDFNIHVIDDGEGIAPQHINRVFERFYRVDPARHAKTGGVGLGLALVKHIAKTHHGKVEVSSTPGKGSHFKLSIPLH